MLCKNSSGRYIGETFVLEERLIIRHYSKPELIIDDPAIVFGVQARKTLCMLVLFDEYGLCIAEIAALYYMPYNRARTLLNALHPTTSHSTGRRNPSYGKTFSPERRQHQSEASKGRKAPPPYERTPEIRKRISNTLKMLYATGVIHNDSARFSAPWARGCYSNAKMGRGIQGVMFSHKNQQDISFRSLLELGYFIHWESDPSVTQYIIEPIQIFISADSIYIPDALINNEELVEIKPVLHLNYEPKDRFNKECDAAKQYCAANNLTFKIVYDRDIGFTTTKYKTYLRHHPDIIEQFNIRFDKGLSVIEA